jgi:hypothetical protein
MFVLLVRRRVFSISGSRRVAATDASTPVNIFATFALILQTAFVGGEIRCQSMLPSCAA